MRGEFINEYQKLNSEDQKTLRRWLWANTVVGAILLAGLIALASKSPGHKSGATAQNATMPVNRPRRLTHIGVQRGPTRIGIFKLSMNNV